MSQFSGSTPIGGVAVIAELDLDSKWKQQKAKFRQELEKLQQESRISVQPDFASQRGRGGGGGGPNVTGVSNGDVSLGSGQYIKNISAARTESKRYYDDQASGMSKNMRKAVLDRAKTNREFAEVARANGLMVDKSGARGGGSREKYKQDSTDWKQFLMEDKAAKRQAIDRSSNEVGATQMREQQATREDAQIQALKNKEEKDDDRLPPGARRLMNAYAIVRAGEAVLNFASATATGARMMAAANSDIERSKAYTQDRSASESAAREIPLAGGLGVAIRNSFDALFTSDTQGDIDTVNQQTADNSDLYSGSVGRRTANQGRRAALMSTMAYGGSFAAQKAQISASSNFVMLQNANELNSEADKYQSPDEETYDRQVHPFLSRISTNPLAVAARYANDSDARELASKSSDSALTVAQAPIKQAQEIAKQEKQAQIDRVDFEMKMSKLEIDTRTQAAMQMQKFQLSSAAATLKWGEITQEIERTPTELKTALGNQKKQELLASRAQEMAMVGGTYAQNFNVGSDISGDPLGIRPKINNVQTINETLKLLAAHNESIGNGIMKIFDTGPIRVGR